MSHCHTIPMRLCLCECLDAGSAELGAVVGHRGESQVEKGSRVLGNWRSLDFQSSCKSSSGAGCRGERCWK